MISIDYNNSLHLQCLWVLSKNNKFHMDDLHMLIYGKVYLPMWKKQIKSMIRPRDIEDYTAKFEKDFALHMFSEKSNLCEGIFICKDNRPVGFLLYQIRNCVLPRIDLTFLLIDKNNQRNGYGSLLLNKFIKDVEHLKPIIIVKVDDELSSNWYIKMGFTNLVECIQKIKDPVHKMYFSCENNINRSQYGKLFYNCL